MSVTDEEAQVLIDLGKKLEGAAGGEELPGEELPGEEAPEELPPEGPMPEEEPEEDLAGLEELEIFDDEELMETVYRRVASRLVKESKRG